MAYTNYLEQEGSWITFSWAAHRAKGYLGGVDYHADVGTPIKAPSGGDVTNNEGKGSPGGYCVIITHPNNYQTVFLHLSRFVAPGRYLQGKVIGYSGGAPGAPGSGAAKAAHIHWHLLTPSPERLRVNPLDFIGMSFGDKELDK